MWLHCMCSCIYNDKKEYGAVHLWLDGCVEFCIDVLRALDCIEYTRIIKNKLLCMCGLMDVLSVVLMC